MKLRPWLLVCLAAVPAGCGGSAPHDVGGKTAIGHVVDAQGKSGAEPKFVWGPAAPEPPLVPSPVPQLPETGTVQNPGDGPKAEDRLVPSTANPAAPK